MRYDIKDYKNGHRRTVALFKQQNFRIPDKIYDRMRIDYENTKMRTKNYKLSFNEWAITFFDNFLDYETS